MQINILEYFEVTYKSYPDRTAVIEGDKQITFHELANFSHRLAAEVIKYDVCNRPIAVFLPKSCESVISDIAITYSGNMYMNLDVKAPISRIDKILNQIRPFAIVTNKIHKEKLSKLVPNIRIIDIDEILLSQSADLFRWNNNLIDTDPYCIINTSGSTGIPKGVILNHRSFIDFTEWAKDILKIGNNEIIGSLSPTIFDIYSFELCMLMSKGSTMVLLPETLAAFPAGLLTMMVEKHVSFIFWVPTIMVNIANLELMNKISLPELKTVWFAGEVFPTKQFNYWKRNLPEAKFVNLYGPIEITLDCTYFIINREIKDNEPIPIGFPCRNTDILILNDKNELVKNNEEGELCVRGSSLAMGYYNDPEKTNLAFVQNPLNRSYPETIYRTGDIVLKNEFGEIIFKGRKDSLVKHLGYRIELGEIEHVILNTLKLVKNACVVYNNERKEITLIYESPLEITIAEFRKQLLTIFPKYMIPTVYHHMITMPRNTNGKIDRNFLKEKFNNI